MRLNKFEVSLASWLVVLACARFAIASPAVSVGLKPSWSAAPFLLELLETAAEEDKSSYFPLLDKIALGVFKNETTDEKLYNKFLEAAQGDGFLADSITLSSFNLALSIHAAAPRIEAHYRYYENSLEPLMGKSYKPKCRVWLQWSKKQHCHQDIASVLDSWERFPNDREELAFDRVLQTKPDLPAAILYADIEDPSFLHYHRVLTDYAQQGVISYRVRYQEPAKKHDNQILLAGYGVELALKKTDYKVMDDREIQDQGTDQSSEHITEGLVEDEEISDIKPVHPKDVAFLGIKASSFVMKSQNKLDSLLRLAQDLPKHSSAITSTEIDSDLAEELRANREIFMSPGENLLWINGLQLDESRINAFSILDTLRREHRLVKSLKSLGLTTAQATKLLNHKIISETHQNQAPQRFDYRDTTEGGNVIVWLNDLEKDERYQAWSTSIEILQRRVFPGQLHQLRKNLYHLVLPLDLTAKEDVSILVEQLIMFVQKKIALRFGIVPLAKSEQAIAQAKVLYYLLDSYNLQAALIYLAKSLQQDSLVNPNKKIFEIVSKDSILKADKVALSFEQAIESEEIKACVDGAIKWAKRLGANTRVPPVFINGLAIPRNEDWMQQMSARLGADVSFAQHISFAESVTDDTDIAALMLDGAASRRNSYVFPEDDAPVELVNILELMQDHLATFQDLPVIPTKEPEGLAETSIWVIGDFDENDGYDLLRSAAEAQSTSRGISLVLFNNPELISEKPALSTLLYQLHQKSFFKGSEQLLQVLKETPPKSWYFNEHIAGGKFWRAAQEIIKKAGFKPGQRGLIINGRVTGPISVEDDFDVDDVKQLLDFERERRIRPALQAVEDLRGLDQIYSSNLPILTNLLALSIAPEGPQELFGTPDTTRSSIFNEWGTDHSAIVTGNKDEATYHIVATVDPTSELAQKLVPILKVLSEMDGVYLRIFLNPERMLGDLTVKRFYRYVLEPKPQFGDAGQLLYPKAEFRKMPVDALLTLGMDVPSSWLVTPKACIYDPDNIQLSSLKDRLRGADFSATYELRSILIQGHARDVTAGGAPKGAQLVLGNEKRPHFADTIVMANLGYFQFKANPGLWKLSLKEGNTEQIFHIDTLGTKGFNSKHEDTSNELAVVTFRGATLYPRLSRKPGMETADVLGETLTPKDALYYVRQGLQMADEALQYIGVLSPPKDAVTKSKQAEINIFSVASGHLYERFLDIMMLSVMKHTNHTVKFWFIENFLSPSFKDFIPHMAKEYAFEYELITYKWPHWLRAQKEKQREIWGYKILFLDVLFPLDLDKVIFVDADQIVRTDLKELVDLDLQGAPYGFTPMCDSRKEIEGFRFWKTGYWKNFLRGLPYHISALYIVDLKRFRQIAAGDRLRQTYHQLSADPGSLANLDQDLPNHMQQQMLPIFSLPQEWLWCETWCSDESLATAKTIDLCNNPMTKEPKLDRAKRQIPEWTLYDEEIARLAERVRKQGTTVDHVADAGQVAKESSKEEADSHNMKDEL
ncbi:UDP-glucose:Glycoprotein glucosyltransferase-domain-containing protein [Kalaharituber pfeilii]|nr:UDP-glucose:Glycoprotein glucosyltransferase-domain-containing protein [Kalaharituber pfeilii]